MQRLLNEFAKLYNSNTQFQNKFEQYARSLKSGDQEFYKDTLMILKVLMDEDMFSKKYTNLPAEEKDVLQRTYYNINLLFDYLLNPMDWMKKKTNLKQLMSNAVTRKETTSK